MRYNIFLFISVFLYCLIQNFLETHCKLSFGPCPKKNVEQEFNMKAFMGTWFQQSRYGYSDDGVQCLKANFRERNQLTAFVNVTYNKEGPFNEKKTIIQKGGISIAIPTYSYRKLTIRFKESNELLFGTFKSAPFWVLSTDYRNYSLVWICHDFKLFNAQYAWVMTRKKRFPDANKDSTHLRDKLFFLLNEFGLNPYAFQLIDQNKC